MPSSSYLYRYRHINFSKYNDKTAFEATFLSIHAISNEWNLCALNTGNFLCNIFVNACYIELFEPSNIYIYMPWNLIDFILNLMLAKYYLIRRHWRGYSWYQTKIISCCSRSNNINWHFIKSFLIEHQA